MKTFRIETTELHEVKKTIFVDADTKKEARAKARANDWHDAYEDEPTGVIAKIKIDKIEVQK